MTAYCANDMAWNTGTLIKSELTKIAADRFGPIDMDGLSRKAEGLSNSDDPFVLWADDTRDYDEFAFAAREDLQVLSADLSGEGRMSLLQKLLRLFRR